MKEFKRITCNFVGEDSELEDQLDLLVRPLERAGCIAIVQYDLNSKGMVASLFDGCKEIVEKVDLDSAREYLTEKADAKEAYRRKVLTEAAEVAAYYNAGTYIIRKGDEYLDYSMQTKVDGCTLHHFHSKILNCWVSRMDNKEEWIDAFTGEIYSALDIFDDKKV